MFRARATLLLFCLAFTGTAVLSQPKVQPKGKNASAPPAQTDPIVLGRTYLNLGDLEKARAYCESALPNQPVEAQKCLAELVQAQYEAKLRDFETSVDLGKREDAIKAAIAVPVKALTEEQKKRYDDTLDKLRKLILADAEAKIPGHKDEAAIEAATVKFLSPNPEQSEQKDEIAQADDIVREAQPGFFAQLYDLLKGSWLPNILAVVVVILTGWLVLYLLRAFLRAKKRYNPKGRGTALRWLSVGGWSKTTWTLAPLVDEKKLGATELVMDAMARLPIELKQEPWKPATLLLRPNPPAPSEAELLSDFPDPPAAERITLTDFEIVTKLREEVQFQEVSLTDAMQQLQLTIGAYKVDSVAKFLSSVGRWLNAGSPTITGTAELSQTAKPDDTVMIRLNCSGGPPPATDSGAKTASGGKADTTQTVSARDYLSVTASTPQEDGTDIKALCADRVVFKLLYRLAYPHATQAQTDAWAAFRQAVGLLERCFKQNRAEETKAERTALLEKAAYNLEFARNHLVDLPQLLWLEGTALALAGEQKYDSAIARFQELEDTPFTPTPYLQSLRNQAMYNRAVVLGRKGKGDRAKAFSVYEELLGKEKLPGKAKLPDSIRWLAGLGKLTVIADCEPEAWKYFDQAEAKEWLEQGNALLAEVQKRLEQGNKRLAEAKEQLEQGEKRLAEVAEAKERLKQEPKLIAEVAEAKKHLKQGEKRLAEVAEAKERLEQREERLAEVAEAKERLKQGEERLAEVAEAKERLEQEPKWLAEVAEAKRLEQRLEQSRRDQRTFAFITLETNRALGKCSLRFAEAFLAEEVLKNGCPVRRQSQNNQLVGPNVSPELKDKLSFALTGLNKCGDDADLLADRAYIKLLFGEYQEAENYARRAILWDPDSERAYYLAAETCFCHGGDDEKERAKGYAEDYYKKVAERTTPYAKPKLSLAAFTALCDDLAVPLPKAAAATAS